MYCQQVLQGERQAGLLVHHAGEDGRHLGAGDVVVGLEVAFDAVAVRASEDARVIQGQDLGGAEGAGTHVRDVGQAKRVELLVIAGRQGVIEDGDNKGFYSYSIIPAVFGGPRQYYPRIAGGILSPVGDSFYHMEKVL